MNWSAARRLARRRRGPSAAGRVDPDVPSRTFLAPAFLATPPTSTLVPWRFAPPTLSEPVSQLCTEHQVTEPAYLEWCEALGMPPDPNRKIWEYAFVVAVVHRAGLLRPGARALGFGVGHEPIPALLARHGVEVLATDAPRAVVAEQRWVTTAQHADDLAPLRRPAIVPEDEFDRLVRFRPVDMNAVPAELHGFDFCWSSCAFEHLGSLEHGIRFVEASLATLKPGGIAVHTTEFNLSSNENTIEQEVLCLYRRRDIETLFERLARGGHICWPLDLHPGDGAMDIHIDVEPYSLPHLKLRLFEYVTTSLGIVVQKRG